MACPAGISTRSRYEDPNARNDLGNKHGIDELHLREHRSGDGPGRNQRYCPIDEKLTI